MTKSLKERMNERRKRKEDRKNEFEERKIMEKKTSG